MALSTITLTPKINIDSYEQHIKTHLNLDLEFAPIEKFENSTQKLKPGMGIHGQFGLGKSPRR